MKAERIPSKSVLHSYLHENVRHGTPDFPVGFYRTATPQDFQDMPFHWHEEMEFTLVRGSLAYSIDLTTLEESELDEASGYGRNFARTGGVTQAVVQTIKERGLEADFKPEVCNGISACEMALRKLKVNRLEANFIEGMACEGGCVQGAGCLVRSPKNRLDVENHAKQAGERTILGNLHPEAEEKAAEGDK